MGGEVSVKYLVSKFELTTREQGYSGDGRENLAAECPTSNLWKGRWQKGKWIHLFFPHFPFHKTEAGEKSRKPQSLPRITQMGADHIFLSAHCVPSAVRLLISGKEDRGNENEFVSIQISNLAEVKKKKKSGNKFPHSK